jgi:hypothetical protein
MRRPAPELFPRVTGAELFENNVHRAVIHIARIVQIAAEADIVDLRGQKQRFFRGQIKRSESRGAFPNTAGQA